MGAAGGLLTIGTAVLQGVQGYRQSKAEKQQGLYESDIMESNARMANMQADDATYRGEQKALEIRKKGKIIIGKQRAAMAAQGLDIEADDALAIQQETAENVALDSEQTKRNAWMENWGYRVQSQDYKNKARFADITGRQRSRATILTTGLGILNTFASSGGKSSSNFTTKY
jgi:hypothetical protein